jgi:anti-anti-sigma factor
LFRRNAVRRHEEEFGAARQLDIHSQRDDRAHVVALAGDLDLRTAAAFEDELKRVEATDAPEIIVDLSGLTSIDSVGVKTFIHAYTRSRLSGERLTLVPGIDQVHRRFETTGLMTRLPFCSARDVFDRQA